MYQPLGAYDLRCLYHASNGAQSALLLNGVESDLIFDTNGSSGFRRGDALE